MYNYSIHIGKSTLKLLVLFTQLLKNCLRWNIIISVCLSICLSVCLFFLSLFLSLERARYKKFIVKVIYYSVEERFGKKVVESTLFYDYRVLVYDSSISVPLTTFMVCRLYSERKEGKKKNLSNIVIRIWTYAFLMKCAKYYEGKNVIIRVRYNDTNIFL